ncbi:hypothetical protein [Streptomyces neyagawaensis]|uniref:hypothetical protein n=1 Tax=Streptomyces neyagawaensis TaxID=42238 RepID=UPI000A41C77C|nr:hypothetical protein [Streptomyces neyagawaensis]MCL6739030.1 hypothetical protein [Streptomyces neyagawaensis]MDE1688746.1 hypothetical protein [Streptomyces neyagawaensis]
MQDAHNHEPERRPVVEDFAEQSVANHFRLASRTRRRSRALNCSKMPSLSQRPK